MGKMNIKVGLGLAGKIRDILRQEQFMNNPDMIWTEHKGWLSSRFLIDFATDDFIDDMEDMIEGIQERQAARKGY